MSGHSKWHNVQGRKNAQDAKREKVSQKLSHEIYTAVKTGGPDPSMNPALQLVVNGARAASMPDDDVERVIKRAISAVDETNYDKVTYEGYGPDGVGVLAHALTDNHDRTATSVRVAFTRNGGSLGGTSSASYLLDRRGYIVTGCDGLTVDEETMFEDVLEAGTEDPQTSPEIFKIYTAPENFTAIRGELEKEFTLTQTELTMIPQTTINLNGEQREQLERLVDKLEDDDDVLEVSTAAEM